MMSKFENMDVIAFLGTVMNQNTGFYQQDFEVDKKTIAEAALSSNPVDRILVWASRPCGTECFRERDVFVEGSGAHNTMMYHMEHPNGRILYYAVEIVGLNDAKVIGHVYKLDRTTYYESVRNKSIPALVRILVYENGTREISVDEWFDPSPDFQLGKFLYSEFQPTDQRLLQSVLQEEVELRKSLPLGKLEEHIRELRKELIEREAENICKRIQEMLKHPLLYDGAVELSPIFKKLASDKDKKQLCALLPSQYLAYLKM